MNVCWDFTTLKLKFTPHSTTEVFTGEKRLGRQLGMNLSNGEYKPGLKGSLAMFRKSYDLKEAMSNTGPYHERIASVVCPPVRKWLLDTWLTNTVF
jgi:hypothetical protein